MKRCSCGKLYCEIPKEAKLHIDCATPGYFYNCECKSTLYWPLEKITSKKIIQIIEWGKRKVS